MTISGSRPHLIERAEHEGDDDHIGHHSPEAKDRREHLALWLFIGGDAVFWMLEIFSWFYLRALDTNGMWRGAACTVANPCTDGLGNPITHEISKAGAGLTFAIAGLAVIAALMLWSGEKSARERGSEGPVVGSSGFAAVLLLAAVVLGVVQYNYLPFTTIDGGYASMFEFFMGSTLVHLLLLAFLALGLWNRARLGRFRDGNLFQVTIVRMFAVWIAASALVLAIVMSFFA